MVRDINERQARELGEAAAELKRVKDQVMCFEGCAKQIKYEFGAALAWEGRLGWAGVVVSASAPAPGTNPAHEEPPPYALRVCNLRINPQNQG